MPSNGRGRRLQAFEAAAQQAADSNDCLRGSLQINHLEADSLVDDSSDVIFSIGPKAAEELKKRFLHRLAAMLGDGGVWDAPTIALLEEDVQTKSAIIWLSRLNGEQGDERPLDRRNRDLLHNLASLLTSIHRHRTVNTLDHEWAALWDLTFRLYGSRMRRYVSNTQAIFDQHKASFDDLTTKTLGVLDEHSSDLDHVVGDALVRLRSYACALRVWHLRKEDFNDVIREAFQMISLPHLKGRMTSILGKTLAESLHAKIYQLAQPRRVFNTLVRTARTFRAFAAIQIRLGLPPTAFSSPVSTPSSTLQSPTSVKEESKRACIFKNAEATPAEDSIERFLATACQYLPDSEQSLGLKQLRPVERQQAFLLVAALEDGQNPDPSWDAYHIFGYSACQNEHELHILGSVYREIITNCADKQGIFYELSQALLQNKVISFMDRHERTQSRQQIPGLKEFLQTKPNERPSVFRLVQFIRDDGNTDPPPVLSRDYGFSLCKVREEVVALKLIYQEMLFQLSPLQLHDACCKGELRQVAESIGIAIEKKYKRLLANQYPIPSLGYEEISSGTPYEKGLFRWKGKKKSGTNRPTEQ